MPRGGRRPGAGRKRQETRDRQKTNRDLVLELYTAEDARLVIDTFISFMRAGSVPHFAVMAPILFGKEPDVIEQKVSGTIEHISAEQVDNALAYAAGRRGLRVVA